MAITTIKVGCCGFPVARRKYFDTFPAVEVQQTFYQPPRPDVARRWRQEAPSDFEFTVKAWQLITHEPRSPTYRRLKTPLREEEKERVGGFRWTGVVRRAWETMLEIARLLCAEKILFQCPASFKPSSENKDRVSNFFSRINRRGLVCIWEPRGNWHREEIGALCRELDLVHCVDPFQAEPATHDLRYFRLHGIGGYRHEYTDVELQQLSRHLAGGEAHYFMFNNISMFRDAVRFQKLLE